MGKYKKIKEEYTDHYPDPSGVAGRWFWGE